MEDRKSDRNYDLVLVLGFFRRVAYYLSVIKHLGREFRIGLLPIPLEESLRSKHRHTQEEFTQLCVDLGAELVEDGPASASLGLIPQQPYSEEILASIDKNLQTDRRIAVMALAWAGLHETFLERLNIRKAFIVHKELYDFLLQHRRGSLPNAGCEMVEVGLPYKKYPVFDDFQTDYLLAIPTPFSFPTEKDKWDFLETVLKLFQQMDPADRVVHKPHNAVDYDYFSGWKYRRLAKFLRPVPDKLLRRILPRLAEWLPDRVGGHAGRLFTAILYERIMDRVDRIEDMARYHYCAMEALLPGVTKGVIGGLSNTIWGTLYFSLPFYNCVDISRQDRRSGNTLYRHDPSQFLDLNLRFFNVPYCEGNLEFDPEHFHIIAEHAREADLLQAVRRELARHASAQG
jgi:hypothetical protein